MYERAAKFVRLLGFDSVFALLLVAHLSKNNENVWRIILFRDVFVVSHSFSERMVPDEESSIFMVGKLQEICERIILDKFIENFCHTFLQLHLLFYWTNITGTYSV